MKISYNPNNLNSLVIGAIKLSKNRAGELNINSSVSKQTPLEYMQENFPKEKVPMAVFVLSTPGDPRHSSLAAYVRVAMSDLNQQSLYSWSRLFANELPFINKCMEIGGHYSDAIVSVLAPQLPVSKPAKKKVVKKEAKKAPAKKAAKKTTDYSKLSSAELRKLAQKKGIKGYASMKKADIIKRL